MQAASCEILGWMSYKLELRLLGEVSSTSDMLDNTTLMAEREEELKTLLKKLKEEGEKSWLKTQHSKNKDHGIWSHHFTASRRGKSGSSDRFFSSWAPKSLWMVTAATKLEDAYFLEVKL